MNLKSILCVCLAVTLTLGNQPQDGVQPNGDASYEFGYDIHNPGSNDIKSHHEVRDGKNVLGFYTFKEADGSIRIVKYKVTPDTGFEAVVEKINPDPLPGNSIDGQVAAPSTHGLPQAITETRGGANSQYVAGHAGFNGVRNVQNQRRDAPPPPPPPPPIQRNLQLEAQTRQRYVQQPQQQPHVIRHRDPYVIRRNHNQQLPAQESRYPANYNHRVAPDAQYVDVPRGRQRTLYLPQRQPDHRQLQPQNNPHNTHRFAPPARHGQVQSHANNLQPNPYPAGPIVYIDGVPYIDDIGAFSGAQSSNKPIRVNGHVFVPTQGQGQYQVREVPDPQADEEAATNEESNEQVEDEDKEEYEEEDDDDDHADFEDDDEEDDEDSEESRFYEDDDHLVNHQQKEYDRLRKAYDGDDKESVKEQGKAEEKQTEEQKSEPVQEQ